MTFQFTFESRGDQLPDSLYKNVKSYDTDLLKKIWPKILFTDQDIDFEISWKNLLKELRKIK